MPHEESEKSKITYGELPHTHLLHGIGIGSFFVVWGLDSFIFKISTFLSEYIHWIILLIASIALIVIGFAISGIAHEMKFHKKLPGVINTGVYGFSRHPMYLGYMIAYIGAFVGTLSLLSLAPLAYIMITNQMMANFEEKKMIETFGNEYVDYQKQVPKWLLI